MPTKTSKDHEKAIKTVAKGAGIAFIGLLVGKFFAYLTRVFIARTLGPDSFGLISIGISLVSVFTTFSLVGLGPGLTRFISYYIGKKNLAKVKGSIFSSFKISLPLSFLFFLIFFLFSDKISIIFSKPELSLIFKVLSFSIPFSVILTHSSSIFTGFKKIKYKFYTKDISHNILTFLFLVFSSFFGLNLFNTSLSITLGFIFSSLIGFLIIKNKILPVLKNKKTELVLKDILYFSWPLLVVSLLSLLMAWTDIIMLGYFEVSSVVGIYTVAINTCILLTFLLRSFGFIFLPLISELFSKNKKSEIRNIYRVSTRWLFAMVFPLFLLFVLFPDNILRILFGSEYVSGSIVMIILSLGYLVNVSVGLSIQTIISIGKTKVNMYLTSLVCFSNIFLNFLLIPVFGMVGAAIAMSFSLILYNVLSLIYLFKKINIQPYDSSHLKIIFSSILSVIIIYFVFYLLPKPISLLTNLFGFSVFLLLYMLIFLFTKGIKSEDVLILKTIEKKTGIKVNWLREFFKKFI